jgi:uncharacterized membrane protein
VGPARQSHSARHRHGRPELAGHWGAVLSGRGGQAGVAAAILVSTELVADKPPAVSSRLQPGPLAGRVVGGGLGAAALARGRDDAGAAGTSLAAIAGAGGAWVGAVAGAGWREAAAARGWTWQAAASRTSSHWAHPRCLPATRLSSGALLDHVSRRCWTTKRVCSSAAARFPGRFMRARSRARGDTSTRRPDTVPFRADAPTMRLGQ